MAKKYIGSDYTLNIYSQNNDDFGSTEVEHVTTQITSTYITSSWTEATSSYSIISGSTGIRHDFNTGNQCFGYGCVIDEDTMVVGSHFESATLSAAPTQGVFIFKSGSTGWVSSSAIIPAESDWPKFFSVQSGGKSQHEIKQAAASFDYDKNTIVICGPAKDADSGGPASAQSGRVLVYESGSNGWAKTFTINTGSLSVSARNLVDKGLSFGRSARVSGDKIVVGTSLSTSPHRKHLFVFKSSSGPGWAYEATLTAGYENGDGDNTYGISPYSFESNLHIDITNNGTRIIAAGAGESTSLPSIPIPGEFGSIVIWDYKGGAWVMDSNQLTLIGAGLNNNVSTATYGTNYDKEYKLYTQLGRNSCAVSGSYIVATAKGRVVGSPQQRLPNRLFIFKSGSTGWVKEADFKSPNPLTEGLNSATYDDLFGNALTIQGGAVAVTAPQYRGHSMSNPYFGRTHIYMSSSASGWALKQSIDNPYSGSADTGAGGDWHAGRDHFSGPTNNWSTDFGRESVYPGLHGANLVIPWGPLAYRANEAGNAGVEVEDQVAGGVYVLYGSGGVDKEETTESSEFLKTSLPFRFSVNGPMNIRLQSGNKSHKTFIGEQKS